MRLGHVEDVVRHLVDARPGHDAADLRLLAEGDDVRLDADVLDGPHRAGRAHAGLHLVEDEQELVLVGEPAQLARRTRAGSGCRRPRPGSAR